MNVDGESVLAGAVAGPAEGGKLDAGVRVNVPESWDGETEIDSNVRIKPDRRRSCRVVRQLYERWCMKALEH